MDGRMIVTIMIMMTMTAMMMMMMNALYDTRYVISV